MSTRRPKLKDLPTVHVSELFETRTSPRRTPQEIERALAIREQRAIDVGWKTPE
jgi:hypothetical protein